MKKLFLYTFVVLMAVFFNTCGKDDSFFGNEDKAIKNLPGTLYWSFAGDANYYNFASGKYVKGMITLGGFLFDDFDITWDNNKTLLTLDVKGTYNFDERRFVLRKKTDRIFKSDADDGNNLFDIVYEWGKIGITSAHISPDEKYLALEAQHFADMPITILNAKTGELISNWMVSGVSFLNYGAPVWTADNTLYFRIGSNIYKSSPTNGYKSAPRVLALGDEGGSYVTVNPQGTKFVFRRNKHLWMCNIDGSELQQITTSETMDFISYDGENRPTFSPDGKYIAFTGSTRRGAAWSDHDYPDGSWVAGTGGSYGYIIIIPADGKLYDLNDKKSGAIWPQEPDSSYGIACSGNLIWR